MLFVGIGSLAASLLDIKPYLHLQLVPHITKYHQVCRGSSFCTLGYSSLQMVVVLADIIASFRLCQLDRTSDGRASALQCRSGH